MNRNRKLTAMQERFAIECSKGLSASEAAIRAGYSRRSAAILGGSLLKDPRVTERVQKELDKSRGKQEISSDRVIQEIAVQAFANVDDYLTVQEDGTIRPDIQKLSSGKAAGFIDFKITERPGRRRFTMKVIGKERALKLLARHVGVDSTSRRRRPTPSGLETLSLDELRRLAEQVEEQERSRERR